MAKENSSILDIIRGISTTVAQVGYDGALDKETQKPIETGLKRDTQDFVLSTDRVMDGFSVKFRGSKLCIYYQSEVMLKDVHDKNFESDTERTIDEVASFLKKEYKKINGKALTLTPEKKSFKASIQNISNVRSSVLARKEYEIGGVVALEDEKPKVDKAIESWLSLNHNAKKPENVSIKPSDNEKEIDILKK